MDRNGVGGSKEKKHRDRCQQQEGQLDTASKSVIPEGKEHILSYGNCILCLQKEVWKLGQAMLPTKDPIPVGFRKIVQVGLHKESHREAIFAGSNLFRWQQGKEPAFSEKPAPSHPYTHLCWKLLQIAGPGKYTSFNNEM